MTRYKLIKLNYNFLLILLIMLINLIETKPTNSATSKNHELLTKLGLTRVRAPNSHHRKRLAVESRHHGRSDDSHMFIIKLPPNQHYYVHNRPNAIDNIPSTKNIPLGFKNNGKPAKIYHWNIPVIKKIANSKLKSRTNENQLFDIDDPKNWNEILDKSSNKDHIKPLKSSYYIPKTKNNSFRKYFPGNGKPHSFYVIEKSKKAHFHRLLP